MMVKISPWCNNVQLNNVQLLIQYVIWQLSDVSQSVSVSCLETFCLTAVRFKWNPQRVLRNMSTVCWGCCQNRLWIANFHKLVLQHIAGEVEISVMYTYFSYESIAERIFKIGPHLPKLLSNINGHTSWDMEYMCCFHTAGLMSEMAYVL